MILLTKELLQKLPSTDKASAMKNPTVWVKFFLAKAGWAWFACGYDPKTGSFWGLVEGDEIEIGDFSLMELLQLEGELGSELERDLYFSPCRLSRLVKQQYPTRRIWGWSR